MLQTQNGTEGEEQSGLPRELGDANEQTTGRRMQESGAKILLRRHLGRMPRRRNDVARGRWGTRRGEG